MKVPKILNQIVLLTMVGSTNLTGQEPIDPGPSDVLIETGRIHMTNPGESVFVGDGSGMNIIDWESIKCNTGVGYQALFKNTEGSYNTALGGYALFTNEVGNYNTTLGCRSALNFDGFFNTMLGYEALGKDSTDGSSGNTAIGYRALYGDYGEAEYFHYQDNTVIGNEALHGQQPLLGYSDSNIRGNTAIGNQSSYATIGDENTAVGKRALLNPTRSEANTAIGKSALLGINPTGEPVIWYHIGTGIGHNTLIESSNSTGVGESALMKSIDGSAFGGVYHMNQT